MKRVLLTMVVCLLFCVGAAGQSRTADRLMDSSVSALDTGNPPNGSVRNVINGVPNTVPCQAAAPGATVVGAFGMKLQGVWVCFPKTTGILGDALKADPLSQFAATTSAQLAGVITNETGTGALVFGTSPNITTPTGIVKADVGLANVENTSDANKPVSIATQTALDLKANIASPTFTGTVTIPTPFTLGAVSVLPTGTELNFVDGVTSGIQTQLDGKQPLDSDLSTIASLTPTTDNFIVSVSSAWASRTPAQVKTTLALNNVDNTSDASKPVSTAQQTALDLKANIASPTLTGTPAAPTAAAGTNTTQIATTAHVFAERSNTATLTNKTISGASNTLTNIGNSSLTNSGITIGSTSVSLGGTAATVAGLTLTTPTIGSFANATHDHTNAAGGGQLTDAALSAVVGLAKGGTGAALSDPNADRLLFWDDSAGTMEWLTLGTNLSITGTTLNASGGGGGVTNSAGANVITKSDGTNLVASPLTAPDANTVEQRNAANAQAFHVYETTDAPTSNYSRLFVGYSVANSRFEVAQQIAGTGTERPLALYSKGVNGASLVLDNGGDTVIGVFGVANRWSFKSAGDLLPAAASTYSIGSASFPVATINVGTVNVGANSSFTNDVWSFGSSAFTQEIKMRDRGEGTVATVISNGFSELIIGRSDAAVISNGNRFQTSIADFPEAAAPATPASGKVRLYAKSDGLLYSKDDAGTETVVTGGGGSGSPGGSDTQLQRNNAGVFGGISGATSNGTDVTFGSGNLRAVRPQITTSIDDANGNEVINTPATASAVNEVTITNAATGGKPTIAASGADSDVDLRVQPQLHGSVYLGGNGAAVNDNGKIYLQTWQLTSNSGNGLQLSTAGGGSITLNSSLVTIPSGGDLVADTMKIGEPFGDSQYAALWHKDVASAASDYALVQSTTGNFTALNVATSGFLDFRVNNISQWKVDTSGDLVASTDNVDDLGNSANFRPRTGYFGTSIFSPLVNGGSANGATLTLQGSSGAAPAASYVIVNPQTVDGTSPAGLFIGAPTSKTLDDAFISDMLHLQGSDTKTTLAVLDGYGAAPRISGRRANGTSATPSAVSSGQTLLRISAHGYQTTTGAFSNLAGVIEFTAAEAFTSTANGTDIGFFTTSTGSTTLTERWRITNTGNLIAQTDNSWDLGASGATRPRTGYFGTSVVIAGLTATVTVASGTSALGTGAISSGTCATVVTTSATGTATTDAVIWGFNGDPTGVTGYQASTNGMLTIIAYPTTNNVNFKVCNNTSSSVTPGAVTLNWRVAR